MTENRNLKAQVFETIKTFAIALIIAILVKFFIIDATIVSGDSMNDTLITQDMLMVDKITPRFTAYDRGDIVIVKAPYEERKLYVKRVVGLPGEIVELIDGNFYIDGQKLEERYTNVDYTYNDDKTLANYWELGDDEYFIVGDNRIHNVSHDSRAFGPVSIENFVGQAFFRFYPFDSIGSLK